MVVMKTLFKSVFGMSMTRLELRSAVKELLKIFLSSRMLSVAMENSPSRFLLMDSMEPRNKELAFPVWLVFRSLHESLALSPTMTSTVSRMPCGEETFGEHMVPQGRGF